MSLQQIESRSQKEDLPRSIERANEDDASRSNQSLSDDILQVNCRKCVGGSRGLN